MESVGVEEMKGTQELVIGVVAIVAILAVLLFLITTGLGTSIGLPAWQNPAIVIQQPPPASPTAPEAPRQSISDIFHAIIDPADPFFLNDRRLDCLIATTGTWYDTADRMGCFGMAPGTFDPTSCTVFPMSYFAGQCNAIAGATWVCNADSAACYYA
jgi:hypothetical protein